MYSFLKIWGPFGGKFECEIRYKKWEGSDVDYFRKNAGNCFKPYNAARIMQKEYLENPNDEKWRNFL